MPKDLSDTIRKDVCTFLNNARKEYEFPELQDPNPNTPLTEFGLDFFSGSEILHNLEAKYGIDFTGLEEQTKKRITEQGKDPTAGYEQHLTLKAITDYVIDMQRKISPAAHKKVIQRKIGQEITKLFIKNQTEPFPYDHSSSLEEIGIDCYDAAQILNDLEDEYEVNFDKILAPLVEDAREKAREKQKGFSFFAPTIRDQEARLNIGEITDYILQETSKTAA